MKRRKGVWHLIEAEWMHEDVLGMMIGRFCATCLGLVHGVSDTQSMKTLCAGNALRNMSTVTDGTHPNQSASHVAVCCFLASFAQRFDVAPLCMGTPTTTVHHCFVFGNLPNQAILESDWLDSLRRAVQHQKRSKAVQNGRKTVLGV